MYRSSLTQLSLDWSGKMRIGAYFHFWGESTCREMSVFQAICCFSGNFDIRMYSEKHYSYTWSAECEPESPGLNLGLAPAFMPSPAAGAVGVVPCLLDFFVSVCLFLKEGWWDCWLSLPSRLHVLKINWDHGYVSVSLRKTVGRGTKTVNCQ